MPTVVNSSGARFGVLPGKVGTGSLTATILLKATFDLRPDAPAVQIDEDEQPHIDTDIPWDNDPARGLRNPSDFAYFKPGTDLLLAGHCHAPGGRAVPYTQVSFGVGSFRKVAVVFGDRMIRRGVLASGISEPVPFVSMPLEWGRAWGGAGFARNPVGRGATDVVLGDGTQARLLPNVESLDRLVGPELRDVEPTGFGPIDPAWPQRMKNLGSFDGAWLKERWPWFPDDFDWTYFSSAPQDQYLKGTYLRGDELLELVNLDPEHPTFRASLPGLQARAFIRVRRGAQLEFREVPLRIDTLFVDMDVRRVSLTWRGVTPVDTIKLKEVEEYFFLLEPGRSPLGTGLADYEALYLRRLAEMRDEFKVPPVVLEAPPPLAFAVPSIDWAVGLRKLADSIRAASQAPAPPAVPPVSPMGTRFPAAPPPPTVATPSSVAEINARIKADWAVMDAHDPGFSAKYPAMDFSDLEADIAEIEAFTGIPEEETAAGEGDWDRERVVRVAAEGGHFERQDLSGLDLSGLDLTGVRFIEADLSEVDFSRSTLRRADFTDANLTECVLTGADLETARLDGADLSGVSAEGVRFAGASILRTEFSGGRLARGVFDDVSGGGVSFCQCDLREAAFPRAALVQADFSDAVLTGVSFMGATLTAAEFEGADASGANFESASAINVRASKTNLRGARFRGARMDLGIFEDSDLTEGDFRETKLRRATLTGARVGRAVFALADLREARMDDLSATGATFVGVDLFRSILERADLTGASFLDCNLFEVEFFEAVLDRTVFREVNLKGTKIER